MQRRILDLHQPTLSLRIWRWESSSRTCCWWETIIERITLTHGGPYLRALKHRKNKSKQRLTHLRGRWRRLRKNSKLTRPNLEKIWKRCKRMLDFRSMMKRNLNSPTRDPKLINKWSKRTKRSKMKSRSTRKNSRI